MGLEQSAWMNHVAKEIVKEIRSVDFVAIPTLGPPQPRRNQHARLHDVSREGVKLSGSLVVCWGLLDSEWEGAGCDHRHQAPGA